MTYIGLSHTVGTLVYFLPFILTVCAVVSQKVTDVESNGTTH